MKKSLLTIAVALFGLSVSATPFGVSNKMQQLHPELRTDLKFVEAESFTKADLTAKTRAEGDEEVYYSLAGDPAGALTATNYIQNMQIGMAFQIEQPFLASIEEGEITGITFYTGIDSSNDPNIAVNSIPKATVFITEALDGTPLYEQKVDCPPTPFTQVYAKLDTPFKIPAGKKIFVGVYMTLNSPNNNPIVIDGQSHLNYNGGWVGLRTNSISAWSWDNVTDYYGFMTLGATISAKALPKNTVSVLAVDGQPAALEGEPFAFQFLLQNNGANDVQTLTMEFNLDGEETIADQVIFENPWGLNQLFIGGVPAYIATKAAKSTNLNVRVTEINGEPNTASDYFGSYPITIVPAGKELPQNVVIEELTSTSCVYCPVGYTVMERIHETCTDGTIIPVCVHVNSPGKDPLTAASYNGVYQNFGSNGVPNTVVNRAYVVYPDYESLMELSEELKKLPAIASVEGDASIDKETGMLTINTKTKFAFDYEDGESDFRLAYGITEDNVGPYTQQNGYAGTGMIVDGNWSAEPETVELVYNDVARQLDKYRGIAGSIPTEIKAGEEYDYTHSLKVVKTVNDYDKITVVVYLVNYQTEEVLNVCRLKNLGNGSFSGVEETIATDEAIDNAPVEYYNLQGVKVANPSKGLYITRQGNRVSKTIIR